MTFENQLKIRKIDTFENTKFKNDPLSRSNTPILICKIVTQLLAVSKVYKQLILQQSLGLNKGLLIASVAGSQITYPNDTLEIFIHIVYID